MSDNDAHQLHTSSMAMSSGEEMDMSEVDDEYCVQYFGFMPQSFFNGMYNSIVEYLKEAMTALNDSILNTFNGTVSEAELKEISYKQSVIAVERLDEKFDKAEVYLRNNVFNIPRHVVLPEDKLHVESPCSDEEMKKLDEDIQNVVDRIVAVKYANSQLRDRMMLMKSLQEEFDVSLKTVQKIQENVTSQSHDVIQTTSSLKNITQLVKNIDLNVSKS